MKIGVLSSRANSARQTSNGGVFEDENVLKAAFDKAVAAFGKNEDPITFVSGGGRGPETFAKVYAEIHEHGYTAVPPRSKTRGAMAFHERNTTIISLCDAMVVFWGGEDMYIANALSQCMFGNIPVIVYPI